MRIYLAFIECTYMNFLRRREENWIQNQIICKKKKTSLQITEVYSYETLTTLIVIEFFPEI